MIDHQEKCGIFDVILNNFYGGIFDAILKYRDTRSSGHYAPFLLAPAEGWGPFGPLGPCGPYWGPLAPSGVTMSKP